MAVPQRSSGSRFTLAILLLTSVTLISLDARGYEPLANLRKASTAIIQPFRNIASTVFDPVADAWESLSEGDTLEKENALLREQLSELLEYRVTTEGAVEELAALRTQLDLENLGGHETIVAEITARSVSNFDPYIIEIGKGTQSGIREGMAVVSVGGLIGRIEDPGLRSSRVRLITDPNVNVGVLAVGTNEIGILSGGGVGQPFFPILLSLLLSAFSRVLFSSFLSPSIVFFALALVRVFVVCSFFNIVSEPVTFF